MLHCKDQEQPRVKVLKSTHDANHVTNTIYSIYHITVQQLHSFNMHCSWVIWLSKAYTSSKLKTQSPYGLSCRHLAVNHIEQFKTTSELLTHTEPLGGNHSITLVPMWVVMYSNVTTLLLQNERLLSFIYMFLLMVLIWNGCHYWPWTEFEV